MENVQFGNDIDPLAMTDGRLDDLLEMVGQLASVPRQDIEAAADEVIASWRDMFAVNTTTQAFIYARGGIQVRPNAGPTFDAALAIATEMGIPYRDADRVFVITSDVAEFIFRVMAARESPSAH